MKFTINLATRVYIDSRKVSICCAAAAAVIAVWILFSLYRSVEYAADLNSLAQYSEKLNSSAKGNRVPDGQYTAFLAEVKNVNSILYKRSYDWLGLLANLERLIPEGVSLRSLEPSDRGATLKLSASARNFSGVRSFIENLESSKVFTDIYLTDQAAVKESDQKVLNFTVVCKVPAS